MNSVQPGGIVTPEAVLLEFETAGAGSRAAGEVLDVLLQFFVLGLVVRRGRGRRPVRGPHRGRRSSPWSWCLLVVVGYPVASETLWNGRTLGKAALGLRVVTVEGGPVRFRHSAIRGIVGLFEIYLTLGSVALFTIIFSRRDQRVGDHMAGTIILRERAAPGHAGHGRHLPHPVRHGGLRGLARRGGPDPRAVRRHPLVPAAGARPQPPGPLVAGREAGQRHRPGAAPAAATRGEPRALPGLCGRRLPAPPHPTPAYGTFPPPVPGTAVAPSGAFGAPMPPGPGAFGRRCRARSGRASTAGSARVGAAPATDAGGQPGPGRRRPSPPGARGPTPPRPPRDPTGRLSLGPTGAIRRRRRRHAAARRDRRGAAPRPGPRGHSVAFWHGRLPRPRRVHADAARGGRGHAPVPDRAATPTRPARTAWPVRSAEPSTTPATWWPRPWAPSRARWCSPAGAPSPTTWPCWAASTTTAAWPCARRSSTTPCVDPVASRQGVTVPVDAHGVIDLDALEATLVDARDAGQVVSVVSVMLVNNEVGTIQPLDRVVELVAPPRARAAVHTDAVQALAWLDVAAAAAGADLVAVSGHKFGGPKGVGALVVRGRAALGRPPAGWRPGARPAQRHPQRGRHRGLGRGRPTGASTPAPRRSSGWASWRDRLAAGLVASVPGAVLHRAGRVAPGRPGQAGRRRHGWPGSATSASPGIESEALLYLLEQHEVYASAGSSCSSGALDPSHVLAAMGVPRDLAKGSLRLSLGWSSTDAEVDAGPRGRPGRGRRAWPGSPVRSRVDRPDEAPGGHVGRGGLVGGRGPAGRRRPRRHRGDPEAVGRRQRHRLLLGEPTSTTPVGPPSTWASTTWCSTSATTSRPRWSTPTWPTTPWGARPTRASSATAT